MPSWSERDDAWHDALVNKHAEVIKSMLSRKLFGDFHAAEELTQETFMTAWEKRVTIPDEPIGWLYLTARNHLRNHQRARQRRPAGELVDGSVPLRHAAGAADANDHPHLRSALGRLSKDDRDLLELKYFDDLTDEQIGAVLRLRPDAVRKRLSRARQRARDVLAPFQSTEAKG